MVMSADVSFADAPALDTIVVPGGAGLRKPEVADAVVAFLKQRERRTRRIVSVCTGFYALAQAGFLDGRRATTHWQFAEAFSQKFPDVNIEPDAIYIRDGKFYTSAGVTAGIDLSLALISDDLGRSVALRVARELVVYLKRSGGQTQFSEPLKFQSKAGSEFSDLAAWMLRNLHKDLSVQILSERAKLGPRHFSRKFKRAFGQTPAEYVEILRLDEARRRLAQPGRSIKGIGESLGYSSGDAFRRAFERHFGIGPKTFQSQFS
jgi:transcriptional regulator GlxA family with amidase domain